MLPLHQSGKNAGPGTRTQTFPLHEKITVLNSAHYKCTVKVSNLLRLVLQTRLSTYSTMQNYEHVAIVGILISKVTQYLRLVLNSNQDILVASESSFAANSPNER